MTKLTTLLSPFALLTYGCGPDTAGANSGAETGVETMSASADETGSNSDPQEPIDVPARGNITVSLVEANPGVAVAISANGQWVGPEARNAPLPKGRNTAIRVYVDVDEQTWIQRDIEARLDLYQPDGSVTTLSETTTISADSSTNSLQSGYLFGALAETMTPGVQFQVRLYEAGTGWESLAPVDIPPAAPAEPRAVGIQPDELNMKLVIVPVDYSSAQCTKAVENTEETLKRYEDAMYQQNPLETLEISWDEPFVVDDLDLSNGNDFFSLLGRAQQYRASQNPDPNVYYYMLFDNCGACISVQPGQPGCLLGVAPGLADDSMGSAGGRVAIGTQYLGSREIGIGTLVHEIGHTQGRSHVECPGQSAASPDVTYPHRNGEIGVWGFGVRDFQVRGATTHTDYMSYCDPTWVSDWQWGATFKRIRTLTSWQSASVSTPDDEYILVGAVNLQTGEAQWWTDRGSISKPTQGHQLRVLTANSAFEELEVQIDPWSEGPMIMVRAPLPADYDQKAIGIEFIAPDRRFTAPRTAIQHYHRPESLTNGQ